MCWYIKSNCCNFSPNILLLPELNLSRDGASEIARYLKNWHLFTYQLDESQIEIKLPWFAIFFGE